MREELKEELYQLYPEILGTVSIEIGNGWYELLKDLCEKLSRTSNPPKAFRIKEKFGGLRFYADGCTSQHHDIIEACQELSYETCEKCGSMEDISIEDVNGYLTTICKYCYYSWENGN